MWSSTHFGSDPDIANWKSCSDILQDIKKTRKCFPSTSFRLGHSWKYWHWPLAGYQPKPKNMVPTPFRLGMHSYNWKSWQSHPQLQGIKPQWYPHPARHQPKYGPPFRLVHNWKSYSDIPHAGYQPKSKEYGLDNDILQDINQSDRNHNTRLIVNFAWCGASLHIAVRV